MKKIIEIRQHDNKLLHLTWVINNICTNKCSYCPENLHNGVNHNYEWSNAKKFFEELFQRYPKLHCSITGGEPSVSPFLEELVDTFKNAGHSIGITSNAAKSMSFWKNISKKLNYICFSYHAEFPDHDFINKVSEAAKNTAVTVRVLMHPLHWNKCIEVYETLNSYNYFFTEPVKIMDWGRQQHHIYDDDKLSFFNNFKTVEKDLTHLVDHYHPKINSDIILEDGSVDINPNIIDYINSNQTNFYGFECQAGLKLLYVNFSGDIYLANCEINGIIGNINQPTSIQWPTKAVICNKTLCHCATDANVNKRML